MHGLVGALLGRGLARLPPPPPPKSAKKLTLILQLKLVKLICF